jgi:hypothetical protein
MKILRQSPQGDCAARLKSTEENALTQTPVNSLVGRGTIAVR